MKFSHLKQKKINMVDISKKKITKREAHASSTIIFSKETFEKLLDTGSPKGEIFNVARCAGIMAAKKTSEIIPLCHNLSLSNVEVNFDIDKKRFLLKVFSKVNTSYSTGVEMEALTACTIASLTIYDMCKSIDKKIIIKDIKLTFKSGGKTGTFKNDKL